MLEEESEWIDMKEYSEGFLGLLVVMPWVERLSLCQRMRLRGNTDI
jgi:hypothetical protein